MDGPTLEERWHDLIERMNIDEIEHYRKKIRHHPQITELVILLKIAISFSSFHKAVF